MEANQLFVKVTLPIKISLINKSQNINTKQKVLFIYFLALSTRVITNYRYDFISAY